MQLPEDKPSLHFMIGQLTAKVDSLLEKHEKTDARFAVLDSRVSVLEQDRAKVVGGAVALSALLGFAIDYLK